MPYDIEKNENNVFGNSVYNQYQYLNTILEESTGAYQRWLDAQISASAGDYGENIGKAFSQIQSVVNKGKGWGTTAFRASVELMLPEDVSPEDQDAIAKWKTKVQKYFKQDGSLNEDSFLNDLFTKGLADHNWEDGTWSLKDGLHLSDIAKEFDMSSEAVKGFFDQLEASYGMKFDWLIFNHVQTESLLKNGWAAGRGRSYAGGTAYISGTNKWPTHAGSMNWSGGNRLDTSGSASGGGNESDKIDWPEIALKRIETLINRLQRPRMICRKPNMISTFLTKRSCSVTWWMITRRL